MSHDPGSPTMGPREFPAYVTDAWRLEHRLEPNFFYDQGGLDSWTVAALASRMLDAIIHKTGMARQPAPIMWNTSQSSAAVGQTDDQDSRSRLLARDSQPMEPRLPDLTLRQILQSVDSLDSYHDTDIDTRVSWKKNFLRSMEGSPDKDCFLVGLPDLISNLPPPADDRGAPSPSTRAIIRGGAPPGGLDILDSLRPPTLAIHATNESFGRTFHRITQNILDGLNWDNVLIAGGMVLASLLHLDPASDCQGEVLEHDIDLYLYGLNVQQANEKIQEIYEVWHRNLPPTHRQSLVVRNARTITLLGDYPARRLQIVLKILPSPLQVLLTFDLDICAIAYDGQKVLMLPRCGRALATGYSVFSMNLVWGSHIGERRSSNQKRLLKYAQRGFGIRFPPSYIRSLGERTDVGTWEPDAAPIVEQGPGLEAVDGMIRRAEKHLSDLMNKWVRGTGRQGEVSVPSVIPRLKMEDIIPQDTEYGRRSLDTLESLIRLDVAWKLEKQKKLRIDDDSDPLRSGGSETSDYDDMPAYHWNEDFNHQYLIADVGIAQDLLDAKMHNVLLKQADGSPTVRKLCRQVCGRNLQSVLDQKLVIPLLMPTLLRRKIETYGDDPSDWMAVTQDDLEGPPIASDKTQVEEWHIHPNKMWAGIDPILDEVVELKWSLHKWFKFVGRNTDTSPLARGNDGFRGKHQVAKYFRRRVVLSDVPNENPPSQDRIRRGLPTLREALLFRAWASRVPWDELPVDRYSRDQVENTEKDE